MHRTMHPSFTTPGAAETRALLCELEAKAGSREAAERGRAALRAALAATGYDPAERAWNEMAPAARRYWLASAGISELKARWQWSDLSPVERQAVIEAIHRAAALGARLERSMRAPA